MAFKDDIKISIYQLDKAAIEQPDLYEEWSKKWADAVFERDKLKESLTVKKAEIDSLIRQSPNKFGWAQEKAPTEVWINQKLTLNADIMNLNQLLIEAQYTVNIMASAKETIEHRGKAMSILTELYKGNYFVAKSRTNDNYSSAVTKGNVEAQSEALDKNERLKQRRRTGV